MTKKQAYKIIKEGYEDYNSISYVNALCVSTPPELRADWCEYWEKINTKNHYVVRSEFSGMLEDGDILTSLTRLMLLHDFIEDTYD